MYLPIELATFALSAFSRGLERLTEDEATTRLTKADGSRMNAISWTVAHIAGHWLNRPAHLQRFAPGSNDSTPPTLTEALALMEEAGELVRRWLPDADSALLGSTPEGLRGENVGTGVMRATLHTWFHAGEINAMRQLLGHAEIGFVGDIRGRLEWRSSPDGSLGHYLPRELALFAISEFERGLEGLSAGDAQVRVEKADGTRMNAISWTVGHIATHWLWDAFLMTNQDLPDTAVTFFGRRADPTPPPFDEMRGMLSEARSRTEAWTQNTTDALLSSTRDIGPQADEVLGTQLMRAVLHTWFHTGEANAVRQQLGHPDQGFVGEMLGNLEWRP